MHWHSVTVRLGIRKLEREAFATGVLAKSGFRSNLHHHLVNKVGIKVYFLIGFPRKMFCSILK